MKIRLERDALADAVQWAARSLPNRPSIPILAGLRVEAKGDMVVLSSFDYETSAKITVPATVSEEGVALVSGRLLADIARSLPAKPVDLAADASKVELTCGSARFTLQMLPVRIRIEQDASTWLDLQLSEVPRQAGSPAATK